MERLTGMVLTEIDGSPVGQHGGNHAVENIRSRGIDVTRRELGESCRLARISVKDGDIDRQIASEGTDEGLKAGRTAADAEQQSRGRAAAQK